MYQDHDHTRALAAPRLPRRTFLGAAAGMLAAPRLVLGGGEGAGRWRMKLSASTIEFMSLPVEEAIERIAELGFEAVDVWSAHAGCPHLDDVANRLGAEGLVDCCKQHGVALYALSVYKGGFPKYAELIGKSGGGVAIRGAAKACPPSELATRMKAMLEELKPEVELAEEHNATIALENHGGNILNSLDGLKAFLDLNTSPRLGIALAPYHLQAARISVPEAIRTVGPSLLFFYAWQHYPGLKQLPGHGPTDFKPWLAALAEVEYGGYVNPFMHGEPPPEKMAKALAKSRQYLIDCYDKIA